MLRGATVSRVPPRPEEIRMSPDTSVVVLVHGAFVESASWDPVIPLLHGLGLR